MRHLTMSSLVSFLLFVLGHVGVCVRKFRRPSIKDVFKFLTGSHDLLKSDFCEKKERSTFPEVLQMSAKMKHEREERSIQTMEMKGKTIQNSIRVKGASEKHLPNCLSARFLSELNEASSTIARMV